MYYGKLKTANSNFFLCYSCLEEKGGSNRPGIAHTATATKEPVTLPVTELSRFDWFVRKS